MSTQHVLEVGRTHGTDSSLRGILWLVKRGTGQDGEEVGSTVDGAGAPWSNWRRFLGLLMCVMSCGTLATGRYSNEKPPTRSESWQETNQGTILALALIDSGPCPSSSPLNEETKKQTELHVLLFLLFFFVTFGLGFGFGCFISICRLGCHSQITSRMAPWGIHNATLKHVLQFWLILGGQ